MENGTDNNIENIDWENRVLCSDGNCIGVIGPDGRCKECGLVFDGELPPTVPGTEPLEQDPAAPETETAEPAIENSDPDTDDDWENRQLCRDGNCIGIIGPDGKCKVCGLPFEP